MCSIFWTDFGVTWLNFTNSSKDTFSHNRNSKKLPKSIVYLSQGHILPNSEALYLDIVLGHLFWSKVPVYVQKLHQFEFKKTLKTFRNPCFKVFTQFCGVQTPVMPTSCKDSLLRLPFLMFDSNSSFTVISDESDNSSNEASLFNLWFFMWSLWFKAFNSTQLEF